MLFHNNKTNPHKTWSVINDLLAKKKTNASLNNISSDQFNNYFVSVGSSLNDKIGEPSITPSDYISETYPHSFFASPIHELEIKMIVNSLSNSTSSGPDGITAKILKATLDSISKPLLLIFNFSFMHGIFPNALKLARVTPVFKKGDADDCTNYRPISVLSLLSKVLEKLMLARLKNF
jgi:hypothetical protein